MSWFIILAVALCTNAQQIEIQQPVLIEHPQGIAMPFIQLTGLKANFPELRKKNFDFNQLISTYNLELFYPPRNESITRKLTLDNILFHKDDQIDYAPNTPKNAIVTSTMKPPVQYSFKERQNLLNRIESRKKTGKSVIYEQYPSIAVRPEAIPQLSIMAWRAGAPPRISLTGVTPEVFNRHQGYQYRVPASSLYT